MPYEGGRMAQEMLPEEKALDLLAQAIARDIWRQHVERPSGDESLGAPPRPVVNGMARRNHAARRGKGRTPQRATN